MILHSISALKKSASEEGEIKASSIEIGMVGKGDDKFRLFSEEEIENFLKDHENASKGEKMDIEAWLIEWWWYILWSIYILNLIK